MKKEEFDFYSRTSLKAYNLDGKMRYQLNMLDSLDVYTKKHSENVANITCRLCEYLNMEEGFTIYTTMCAYLHDIGKIFIPPSILQKPSRLTDEEFEIMKTHTTIGYTMCMKDPELRPYAAGPLYHHEALNGTGYPNHLTAKDIPYEGQIIRVADEFEAITAKRQYKTHIGIIDTLNILIQNSQPVDKQEGLGMIVKDAKHGKIDKKIVKALFKVVIDDTETEIASRSDYLGYLNKEISRLNKADSYYKKYVKSRSEKKKKYYKEGVLMYLKAPEENIDNFLQVKKEYENTLVARKEHIKNLYKEIKKIKNLKV